MDATTIKGETKMATIKEIYQIGLEAAAKLDSWVFTGIVVDGTTEACEKAIAIASEILPGIALSETLTLAEAFLEKNEAIVPVPGETKCLFESVKTEYAHFVLGGKN
jgi:hypothetical protein